MNKEEILNKIRKSFTKILEHSNFELNDNTTADDIDGWESATHIMIITDIEETFNIKFKLMDLMSMENIGDLVKSIKSEITE